MSKEAGSSSDDDFSVLVMTSVSTLVPFYRTSRDKALEDEKQRQLQSMMSKKTTGTIALSAFLRRRTSPTSSSFNSFASLAPTVLETLSSASSESTFPLPL